MKSVGKPYEGKLHVRFDEGKWILDIMVYTYLGTLARRGGRRQNYGEI